MKSLLREHEKDNSRESGQGILEYSVIIVLVVIIIISFVALFGVDLFNRFISDRARASEEQSTQVTPEPIVSLLETGTQAEVFKEETIRVSNCPAGEPYMPEVERTNTMEYDIELEGQLSGALRPPSIASIQTYYGFISGAQEERSFTLNLEAPPDSLVDYTVEWQRIWKEGNVQITQADGSQEMYPYRVSVGLEYEITQIEQSPCGSTPSP